MYLFQDIKNASKGINFNSAKEARDWYRDQAMKITNIDRNKIMYTADPFKIFQTIETSKTRINTELNGDEFVTGANIGKMYMYFYDAKHNYNYLTGELYASLFFTKGSVCGENNIVKGHVISTESKSGIDKHKEQLKK